ncbi:hypothetical protein [Paraburkholderia sp. J67]|uniref:hypothetical protein n=1 Tax=Paraburkholderia sp. J67 TaxID=2805435 RepID=UPI002ABDC9E7|nr:hypothetical protein [Paraburkholderia sp. J67]
MKKTLIFSLILGVLLVGGALASHDLSSHSTPANEKGMNSSPTIIRLGNPTSLDLSGPGASVDNHPSGATFYQYDWMRGSLGTVRFEDGKHSFVIDNALSALGSADKDVPGGIYKWSVNFGVSADQADTHEAARARVMKFLEGLRASGWSRYIDTDYPRLTGEQAWNYRVTKALYSLDSTYTPTIEQWKLAVGKQPHWKFFADGVYLDVSILENDMGGIAGKSTYLLTVSIKNEYAFYGLGYFPGDPEKIRQWKALIPAENQKYHAARVKTEEALKEQGMTIDTSYEDPPIQALRGSTENSP